MIHAVLHSLPNITGNQLLKVAPDNILCNQLLVFDPMDANQGVISLQLIKPLRFNFVQSSVMTLLISNLPLHGFIILCHILRILPYIFAPKIFVAVAEGMLRKRKHNHPVIPELVQHIGNPLGNRQLLLMISGNDKPKAHRTVILCKSGGVLVPCCCCDICQRRMAFIGDTNIKAPRTILPVVFRFLLQHGLGSLMEQFIKLRPVFLHIFRFDCGHRKERNLTVGHRKAMFALEGFHNPLRIGNCPVAPEGQYYIFYGGAQANMASGGQPVHQAEEQCRF